MATFIDTHTHLFAEEFDDDRELAIIRAKEAGVTRMFMPNVDDLTVDALVNLCNSHEGCFPLIGLHPTSVDADWEKRLAVIERWLRSEQKFYGIGEIGMDLYWDTTYRNEQMKVLDIQIQWAIERNMPLVFHCREAYPELL